MSGGRTDSGATPAPTPADAERIPDDGATRAGAACADLAAVVRSRLAALLANATGVVLLDVPSHPNVGDSAIWLGERAVLAGLGRSPALECDLDTFDPARLRAVASGRTVLIHGGGNLGDLWPAHQELRERAVSVFRDRPVIQLPQSIEFRSEAALDRARRVFAAHPALTLLCRDDRSLEVARRHFDGARVERCPDVALCIPRGLLEASRAPRPTRDVLWLVRSDHESAWPAGPLPPGARDWLTEPGSPAGTAAAWLAPRARRGSGRGVWRALHRRALVRRAGERVARGVRLLSSARVVVTDRLHAHVLCAALGVPHVVLDDAFGKIDAHFATWPALARLACRAADPDEAAERARALFEAAG